MIASLTYTEQKIIVGGIECLFPCRLYPRRSHQML